jgi:ABC-type transporter Mla MlaB component
MAKEDPPAGIFSKMVKFVRNPATNWGELDQKESDRESSYSKQLLKEMIERKRRNDFVRKREFDMLRKLRRREAVVGSPDGSGRPSFFQSSLPSKPDDRAMTLKKIDEIEAQMSMQWWKTKHGNASTLNPANSSFPSSGLPSIDSNSPKPIAPTREFQYQKTDAAPLMPASGAPASQPPAPARPPVAPAIGPLAAAKPMTSPHAAPATAAREELAPLEFTSAFSSQRSPAAKINAPVSSPPAKPQRNGGLANAYDGAAATGFSASKLFALEVDEVQHDPELEEAAIRFANGDDEGAEAGLREALSPAGHRANHEDTWLTLFDLYRATAQHEKFESVAIDFASKFGRSAPQWFSMPEMVGLTGINAQDGEAINKKSDWRCPSKLGVQSVAALNAALLKAVMPWRIDWTPLQSIEPLAVVALRRVFASWTAQPVQLRFMGADKLETVLQEATPSGQSDVAQEHWKLRLESLRLMHRPDEFELIALDFCVTYEVSPPAWEAARCEYKSLDSGGATQAGHTIIGEAMHDSIPSGLSGYGDSQIGSSHQSAQLSAVELSGQIKGDAQATLDKLEQRLSGADIMVISCSRLIRVDFSAAGNLLNWVTARQAEGRTVQFGDVHRLVAAFFHVIGISEHAQIVTRTN